MTFFRCVSEEVRVVCIQAASSLTSQRVRVWFFSSSREYELDWLMSFGEVCVTFTRSWARIISDHRAREPGLELHALRKVVLTCLLMVVKSKLMRNLQNRIDDWLTHFSPISHGFKQP